jgi:uncharacterized protein YifE (UPF0438 family)
LAIAKTRRLISMHNLVAFATQSSLIKLNRGINMGQLISMRKMPIESHKAYLRVSFNPEVPASLFSEYEWDVLCHYGSWLAALMRKDLPPLTTKQARFLAVCAGKKSPLSPLEKVWAKYIKRKAWEMKNANLVGKNHEDVYACAA